MAGRDEYGGIVRDAAHERDALHGLPEISAYSGFSEKVLKRLANEGFPLAFIADRFVSSRRMVDEWFRGQIENHVKQYLSGVSPHLASFSPHLVKVPKTAG